VFIRADPCPIETKIKSLPIYASLFFNSIPTFSIRCIDTGLFAVRVKIAHVEFIKRSIKRYLPNASVYLIGSRVNDHLKGGDIDILVIGQNILTGQEKRNIKIAFYKKFGEQKLDLISFKRDDESSFKDYVLLESVKL
jgi:predicted nucleotidyltransferase